MITCPNETLRSLLCQHQKQNLPGRLFPGRNHKANLDQNAPNPVKGDAHKGDAPKSLNHLGIILYPSWPGRANLAWQCPASDHAPAACLTLHNCFWESFIAKTHGNEVSKGCRHKPSLLHVETLACGRGLAARRTPSRVGDQPRPRQLYLTSGISVSIGFRQFVVATPRTEWLVRPLGTRLLFASLLRSATMK